MISPFSVPITTVFASIVHIAVMDDCVRDLMVCGSALSTTIVIHSLPFHTLIVILTRFCLAILCR